DAAHEHRQERPPPGPAGRAGGGVGAEQALAQGPGDADGRHAGQGVRDGRHAGHGKRVTPGGRPPGSRVETVATSTVSAGPRARSSVSTILAKVIVAVTGIVFVGYILAHMYGNLMILGGKDAFNDYAHHLRTFGEPMLPFGGFLWVM